MTALPSAMTGMRPRLLLTVEEAADVLHIGRSKVFDLIRNGDLGSVKIGRLRRVPVGALDEFMARLVGTGERT
jgi:excisionase family DNA binding protein